MWNSKRASIFNYLLTSPNELHLPFNDFASADWLNDSWFQDDYLFNLRLMVLESLRWDERPKLSNLEYAFLMNLNFDTYKPLFVEDPAHVNISFYSVRTYGAQSYVCDECFFKLSSCEGEDSHDSHRVNLKLEQESFFKSPYNWCANCITQPLFWLFDERSCPGNHIYVSITMH
ncbi:hypothetical protein AVEN_274500-1 [Araneus ventricosus]|uniref:Uncharacterized protein n=1 Tax=Araneus ventricosus TaxID=182803 RepID=A0A4Y2V6G4_ARAVE|nr:hypothetical protein AVEN_274500-1 [Araneus ventricosus]